VDALEPVDEVVGSTMLVSLEAGVDVVSLEAVPATDVVVPDVPTAPDVDDPLAQAPSANANVAAATAVPRWGRCRGMSFLASIGGDVANRLPGADARQTTGPARRGGAAPAR
jgi:hypothetical protein